jgi:uncharacterized protein
LLADLERLIALQRIETEHASVSRTIHDIPLRQTALDARAEAARGAVEAAKGRHAALSTQRRDAEKEMASAEARLAKFRDQQQQVKTNKEYTAMIHEIDMAKADVDKWQEQVILRMDDVDAAAAELKQAEAALTSAEAEIAAARAALEAERAEAEGRVKTLDAERSTVSAQIEDPRALTIFDGLVRTRRTTAVVKAVDGLCTECRVRLRPQVFAEVRRNDAIRQCDNCQRILYFVAPPALEEGTGQRAEGTGTQR